MTWFVATRIGLELGDFATLGPEWWTPTWSLFALSCLALLVTNFAAGLIWGRIVHDMGGPGLRPVDAVRVMVLANLGRYVPGKLWQVAGLVVLAKRVGVPAALATSAAVFGHGLSLASATLVGGVTFSGTTIAGAPGWLVPAAVAATLGVLLLPPVFGPAAARWARLVKLAEEARLLTPHDAARWVGLFVAMWIAYAACFAALAASFGYGASPVAVGSAFVAAYVIGYVAVFAPAGIGVREVALVGLLTPTVGAAAAAGIAVAARIWATAIEVVPGVVFLGMELSERRRESGASAP